MFEAISGTEMWPLHSLMMVVIAVVVIVPFWFIFPKAGYSKWLGLLMVMPLANVILLYFLAFSRWPSLGNGNK